MKDCANLCASVAAIGLAAALGAVLGADDPSSAVGCCEVEAAATTPTHSAVLTALRTRDREVTVYAGETLHFTVVDGHGLVLGEWLEGDEFARRFPDLADHLTNAFAGEQWIDARVHPQAPGARAMDPITGAWPRHGTADETP